MRIRVTSAICAVALSLAAAGAAQAGKVQHTGSITGVAGSKVSFTLVERDGKPVEITKLAFRNVPVTCDDGSGAALPKLAFDKAIKLKGKGFTTTQSLPTGLAGEQRAAGRLKGEGKSASGTFSVDATVQENGGGCHTGELAWKSSGR